MEGLRRKKREARSGASGNQTFNIKVLSFLSQSTRIL